MKIREPSLAVLISSAARHSQGKVGSIGREGCDANCTILQETAPFTSNTVTEKTDGTHPLRRVRLSGAEQNQTDSFVQMLVIQGRKRKKTLMDHHQRGIPGRRITSWQNAATVAIPEKEPLSSWLRSNAARLGQWSKATPRGEDVRRPTEQC